MGESMRKLWTVIRREFGERVRTKWFLVSTLLGPVFFAAIMIGPVWLASREKGSAQVTNVTILDATGAGLGARIARSLADSLPRDAQGQPAQPPEVQVIDAATLPAAEAAAERAVISKQRIGVLVLDTATLAGRRARYAGRNASSIADMERMRDVVRREVLAVRLAQEGIAPGRIRALTGPRLRLASERISDDGKRDGSGAGNAIVATVVAFLLYMMILLYGQNVLRSVLEEKTTRVAEVVVASVRPDILMAGKILGVGAVGVLQQIVWFGGAGFLGWFVAPFLTGGKKTGALAQAAQAADTTGGLALPAIGLGMIAAAIAFFILGFLLYSALFAAAGATVNTEQEAQQAAFPVMLPLIFAAVFIQVSLANPESAMARFAAWFPLTAPIMMPMRMALVSTTPLEVLSVIAGLAVTVLAVTWLAARIYRVGLLMYGKRPTLPELARWIRQAA
ncbi:MAG TPA: ABC transporter permease [Gemmatirosa sp.]|nr:ABC transporter permease [Gemmatirosa sp.]